MTETTATTTYLYFLSKCEIHHCAPVGTCAVLMGCYSRRRVQERKRKKEKEKDGGAEGSPRDLDPFTSSPASPPKMMNLLIHSTVYVTHSIPLDIIPFGPLNLPLVLCITPINSALAQRYLYSVAYQRFRLCLSYLAPTL